MRWHRGGVEGRGVLAVFSAVAQQALLSPANKGEHISLLSAQLSRCALMRTLVFFSWLWIASGRFSQMTADCRLSALHTIFRCDVMQAEPSKDRIRLWNSFGGRARARKAMALRLQYRWGVSLGEFCRESYHIPAAASTHQCWERLSAEDLAEQLTRIARDAYAKLRMCELLCKGWTRDRYLHCGDSIHAFIDQFNHVSWWVANHILAIEDINVEVRRARFSAFVRVAIHL